MIVFTWKPIKYDSGREFIEWSAEWDGRWENDELIDYVFPSHPFFGTVEYLHAEQTYRYYSGLTPSEKQKDFFIDCDDGSKINLGNAEDIDPEEYNPDKLLRCGDIVADNPVTRALCKMLESPKEITKFSGNSHPAGYRNLLLRSLSLFWD